MIKKILDLLSYAEYYGVSNEIDIAKGINKIPTNLIEAIKVTKRKIKSRKYNGN
jgi:hypothetical protein